ncbi:LysM peptidoglycan-binding domain-containing protein [Sporolactobacillus sp. THM7-4]|nr:LysM peptidoglycan-binding domain-containing protein [Sporolactobacillus sp. THM7-4]
MIIHVVQSGETLGQVAVRYHVPPNILVSINQLPDPNRLLIGQSLVIPTAETAHIVVSGETLPSIARQYGVSTDSLKRINRLTDSNRIYPGLALVIPTIRHRVQPGETLAHIAGRYGTTVQAISDANAIKDPDLIYQGMELVIPRQKPMIEVNAYTYQSSSAAVESINQVGRLLTYLAPFAYRITENGTLERMDDEAMISASFAQKAVPMMSITNFTATATGTNLAHTVLATPEYRENLISDVIRIMRQKGYRGLNIDFENVLPADRELYNQFLYQAVNRLHPLGYFVTSALAPKTSATQAGVLYEAHDYEAHGRIADFVVLMTYEWGYRLGPPQAISPIHQMRRVVHYALSVMPAEKIFLGIQIYARDWLLPHVQGQSAETFSMQEAVRRAVQYNAVIHYDPVAQSPFFHYTDEQGRRHEVWFEDARSTLAKFQMAKHYRLRGISYWALGYPYPQNWILLEDTFNIRKLI